MLGFWALMLNSFSTRLVYDIIKQPIIKMKDLFVKMALSSWETQNTRVKKLLDTLTDEQLMSETAPGRNRGVYLIGHLITVSDGLLPLLGFGNRLYPQLEEVFLKQPDQSGLEMPTLAELKKYWDE